MTLISCCVILLCPLRKNTTQSNLQGKIFLCIDEWDKHICLWQSAALFRIGTTGPKAWDCSTENVAQVSPAALLSNRGDSEHKQEGGFFKCGFHQVKWAPLWEPARPARLLLVWIHHKFTPCQSWEADCFVYVAWMLFKLSVARKIASLMESGSHLSCVIYAQAVIMIKHALSRCFLCWKPRYLNTAANDRERARGYNQAGPVADIVSVTIPRDDRSWRCQATFFWWECALSLSISHVPVLPVGRELLLCQMVKYTHI